MRYILIVAVLALAGCEHTEGSANYTPAIQAIGYGMMGVGAGMQNTYIPRTCTRQNTSGIVGQQSKTWITYC
jgi:hypothetical protein